MLDKIIVFCMAKKVIMYTKQICPYCVKAKRLLDKIGADLQEIDISDSPDIRQRMIELSAGKKTVPQIFIGGKHIGGCDDLYAIGEDRLKEMIK